MTVFQGHIIINVMGDDTSRETFDTFLGNADPASILQQMDDGDLIGSTHAIPCHEVPAGDLHARLLAIGNDGRFFDGDLDHDEDDDDAPEAQAADAADARASSAERLERLMMNGTLSETRLRVALFDFVREAGLMDAFSAQLERDLEPGVAAPDGP
jgi:hypothetical protein